MKQASAFITGAGTVAVLAVGLQVGIGLLNPTTGATANNAASNSNAGSTADTSSSAAASSTPSATPSAAPSATAKAAASGSSSSSSSSSSAKSSSGITGTFHGQDVPEDRWGGDVQVDVVFKNGKITAVNTISCNATHGADNACYQLPQEVISAQSANVSTISRATFTSQAYLSSVQSALDAAGFKG